MTPDEARTFQPGRARVLSAGELGELLAAAETWREEDSSVQGPIRLLRLGDVVLAQEHDPHGTAVVRRLDDRAAAERFLAARLATCDRMWDGCGCRVDPHLPWPEPGG